MGKALAENQPQKLHRESQVRLLDGPLQLDHPVGTLSINGKVQGHPPLGGLSKRWVTNELAIFNNLSPVVELDGERGPGGINFLDVQILVDGWQGDVDLYAAYSDVLK